MTMSESNIKVILGSKSPRRRMLMSELRWPVEITEIDVDEIYPDSIPVNSIAEYLSELKSTHFNRNLLENEVLLTADTMVKVGNEVLMKPTSHEDATRMIGQLSGGKHEVITGVTIRTKSKTHSFSDVSEVYFNQLTDEEIQYYIKKYQPFDKAGSYGVQEWIGYIGIRKIVGSYFNIMGLPIDRVYQAINCIIKNQEIPF